MSFAGQRLVEEIEANERLGRELARYKRLEALLRSHSDVEDVPDCGDEQRVRPNQAMSILTEWEGK